MLAGQVTARDLRTILPMASAGRRSAVRLDLLQKPLAEFLSPSRDSAGSSCTFLTIRASCSVHELFETFVKAKAHRLYLIDVSRRVCGVVSLKDALALVIGMPLAPQGPARAARSEVSDVLEQISRSPAQNAARRIASRPMSPARGDFPERSPSKTPRSRLRSNDFSNTFSGMGLLPEDGTPEQEVAASGPSSSSHGPAGPVGRRTLASSTPSMDPAELQLLEAAEL